MLAHILRDRCCKPCCSRGPCPLRRLLTNVHPNPNPNQAVLQSCNLRMKHYFKSHPELVVIDDPDDPKLKCAYAYAYAYAYA